MSKNWYLKRVFTVKDGKGIKSSLFFLSDQALKEKNVYQLSVEEKKNFN